VDRRDTRPLPGGTFDVVRFGAARGGKAPSTRAIQAAIDACGAAGGGTVLLPPGQYLSGALFLRDRVRLYIAVGATLVGSQRFEDYPAMDSRWEGIERKTHASLINAVAVEDVIITGGGIIDGQGAPWWEGQNRTMEARVAHQLPREAENPADAPLRWPRPRLIHFLRCTRAAISGLTIRDSPSANLHLVYSEDVLVSGLTVTGLEANGLEAVIIDSSCRVRITGCLLAAGDAVSIKAGYNEDGRRVNRPCEDIVIDGCTITAVGASALAIGSETAGSIRNVCFANSVVTQARHGVYLRSPRGRGGVVERIRVENVVIDRVTERAIRASHFYDSLRGDGAYVKLSDPRGNREIDRSMRQPVDEGTPTFRDLEFTRLSLGAMKGVAIFDGLPERYIANVRLAEVNAPQVTAGVSCSRVAGVSLDAISVGQLQHPAVDALLVDDLEIHRLRCWRPPSSGPVVRLVSVRRAFVHGCDVGAAGGAFVAREGDGDRPALAANRPR
jgi:polygalacturonase